ncbi:hypothetical protein CLIB1444_08S02344 [[Candida] jaroonii]|uniref:Uncharacterized protein n=1 Tax=[Candida] jaroonii TaxID=467808 RepID=A0ACA9YBB0_9ASCO|nr:hypothetical protein CLIB1444_08S02344 [[Candida] jaroonii]
MKHYKLNNKIEILNDDGVIVASEFRKVAFVLDEQYVVGKVMIEILSLNDSYTREVTIKKEKDNGVIIKTGPRVTKEEVPIIKTEPKKLLKAPRIPLKHTIKPMTAGLSKVSNSSPNSIKKESFPKNVENNVKAKQETPQLKFKIVEPLIRRIPPKSA